MSDELEHAAPQPEPQVPPDLPPLVFDQPKKRSKAWIIIAGLVALVCTGALFCGVAGIFGFGSVMLQKAPVEAVLDDFMQQMKAKNVDKAYELFSPRARRRFSRAEVEQSLQGNNYVLFQGYQSLTCDTLNISAAMNTDPDQPQGTVATVTGAISYEGGFTGKFDAVLEKVGGEWLLHHINVTVPPDKFPQSTGREG